MPRRPRRTLLAFAVASLLTASAHAAERSSWGASELAQKPLLLRIWSGLVALWGGDGAFIDPNGLTGAQPAADSGEAGSFLDPDGVHADNPLGGEHGEDGSFLDPDG